MKAKFILSILLLSTLFLQLVAQEKRFTIKGRVFAEQAVPAAKVTLLLLRAKDSALVKTAVSNDAGYFEWERLPLGKYLVAAVAVNGSRSYGPVADITGAQQLINLPDFTMQVGATVITGVTVSTKKPFIENKIDKTVVNVDASVTNTGLSVLELLEKSPGISIDQNDNVQLKGKQGVMILIDGRPTNLSGQDLANLLRNMPSATVDQLEIMTQPPARYDAAGNSGVINIKTKKNKEGGFNGNVSLSYIQAVYVKSPNSMNLNYRKGKVNVFSNLSYAYWQGFSDNQIVRKFRQGSAVTNTFDQLINNGFIGRPLSAKLGMDYFIDKKTTLGFVLNSMNDKREQSAFSRSAIYNASNTLDSTNYATTEGKETFRNFSANLNFRKILDSTGRELSANIDYLEYTPRPWQITTNFQKNANDVLMAPPYILQGRFAIDIHIYSAKLDYAHPINKTSQFEMGLKASSVKSDNDGVFTYLENNQWKPDARTNHFVYKENIYAGYFTYSKQFKKWETQLGFRFEQTEADGIQLIGNTAFSRSYGQLFPTAYVNYHASDANTFGLSYGRRINRPAYLDLNPFIAYLDKYTYQQGNPFLRPQFTHNIELSYNYKGQLNIAANITQTNDIMNDVLRQDDVTKITLQTKDNIAKSLNLGLAINYNKQLTKWWTTNIFFNAYNNHFNGILNGKPIVADAGAFTFNNSNQFVLGKGWNAELSGMYLSRRLEGSTILARSMGMFQMGASKQILKKAGTIRVVLRDPFYLMRFRGEIRFDNIDAQIYNRWDNRRFILSFTYRFGKAIRQQQRKIGSAQEEQSRINTGGNQN